MCVIWALDLREAGGDECAGSAWLFGGDAHFLT